jgi:hypothetical protein
MITKKTVFVLGAGASAPYKFPVGDQLFKEVVEKFCMPGHFMNYVTNTTNYTENDIIFFVERLRRSGMRSVDAFLERRPEFIDVGKALMATILILREDFDELWKPDWMQYLYARMSADTLEAFGDNDVSFVTFNYDRSLETFLVTSLSNTYDKDPRECAGLIRTNIPIIHLHGHLGPLPWEGGATRMFGSHDINIHIMNSCTKTMKVVHERPKIVTKTTRRLVRCLHKRAAVTCLDSASG